MSPISFELMFHQLLHQRRSVAFIVDEQFCHQQVFTTIPQFLELLQEKYLGKTIAQVLPALLAQQTMEAFAEARATGNPATLDFPDQEQSDKWYRGSVSYVHTPGQEPFFLLGITDISDERRNLQALQFHTEFDILLVNATSTLIQSSEAGFDKALENVLAQIGSFAGVDRAYYFSFDEAANMSNTHEWCAPGVTAEKENLQEIPCAIFPEWMKKLEANEEVYIPTVSELPESWNAEREILEPQGVQSLLALPVMSEGKLYGFMGFDAVHTRVVWDRSKRHLLAILAHNLGSVIMRNNQNRNLREATRQANLLAEEATTANRHKSDFLANMSHEIRTPINGVVGFTELLMETGLNDLQQQYIGKVRNSAQSLLELINQILDFSKIEAGKMELDINRSDLVEIVEKTCTLVRHAAGNKQVELLLDMDPGMPRHFLMDAVRLQQVLANLLSNAVKFTEKGTIMLQVSCRPEIDGRATLHFSVSDTGIGIAEEHRTHIFQAFTQADISTTRKYGGTGLGLAISNSLLHMMGSGLHLESTEGEGSIFSFALELPCFEGAAFDRSTNAAITKVLVVDDHEDSRRILSNWLRFKELSVLEAKSVSEALTLLSLHPDINLAVIDDHMPIIRGSQLLQIIRSELGRSPEQLPVLLLCSQNGGNLAQESAEWRATSLLQKPLVPSLLFQALHQLQPEPEQTLAVPEIPAPQATPIPATLKKILIAEDNATNLLYTRIMVERVFGNCEILVARNGLEAIKINEASQPDLILMDIQMPEMDGDVATLAIRQHEKEKGCKPTPIVALTAHAIKGVKEQYLSVGFNDYLSKPASKEDMQQLLERYA